jgi:hypothetical protein
MIPTGAISARDMARIRGSANPEVSTFYTFAGSVDLLLPGVAPTKLFGIKGASATRCVPLSGERYGYTTREAMFYTDATSGLIVDRWNNPFTDETLPVVHIANDPVQGTFFPGMAVRWCDGTLVIDLSIYPDSPNPLFGDERFAAYGGLKERYRSEEGFVIIVPEFECDSDESVLGVVMHWQRRVTWLPWMKMGFAELLNEQWAQATIFYKAIARPCEFGEIDSEVLHRLEQQVPQFLHAPMWQDNRPPFWGQNSWNYFKDNFESYCSGELAPFKV